MRQSLLQRAWLWQLAALLLLVWLVWTQLPATLLSRWVAHTSGGQVQLSHAQGTLWHGSATLALHGPSGAGLALPQRVHWDIGTRWAGPRPQIHLQLLADCCMQQPYEFTVGRMPGFWGVNMQLTTSQWPLRVLQGLGSPWNSVRIAGQLQIKPTQIKLNVNHETLQGAISLVVDHLQVAMAPGLALGRFELVLGQAQATNMEAGIPIILSTRQGPLLLEGQGLWSPAGGVNFKGTAHAEPASKERLQGLLTLLGEPQGDRHRLEWTHGS
jgi:general secretion pathway protein N